jgi:hypothetical protein
MYSHDVWRNRRRAIKTKEHGIKEHGYTEESWNEKCLRIRRSSRL